MRAYFALGSLVVIAFLFVACSGGQAPPPQPTAPPVQPTATTPPAPQPTTPPPPNGGGTNVKVNLEDPGGSGSYIFDPADFTFNVGDTITFELTSEAEFHTFTVDDLGVDVSVDAETTETVTITFDEAGTFDLICIPHETLGMVGTITVQ